MLFFVCLLRNTFCYKYCLAVIWHILAYATKNRHFKLFFKHLFSCSHIFYNSLVIKLTKQFHTSPLYSIGGRKLNDVRQVAIQILMDIGERTDARLNDSCCMQEQCAMYVVDS